MRFFSTLYEIRSRTLKTVDTSDLDDAADIEELYGCSFVEDLKAVEDYWNKRPSKKFRPDGKKKFMSISCRQMT